MKINRHNYEEYFILYADNELSSDDRRMVEEFANLNPDLKDELDTYLSTVLLPDAFVGFENKEELHRYDESLIFYIDNEMPAAEKSGFEKLVNATPFLQNELELYRKTKLQPETNIVFENKSVLYRSTERKVVRMTWVRWAAAAVILLAVSITAVTVLNKPGKTDSIAQGRDQKNSATQTKDVAKSSNVNEESEAPAPADNSKKDDTEDLNTQNSAAKNGDKQKADSKSVPVIIPNEKKDMIANNNQKTSSDNLPGTESNPSIKSSNKDFASSPVDKQNNVKDSYIASVDVTKLKASSYNSTEGSQIDDYPRTIDPDEEGGQNKKSRGLFRKITRVFEMNTGIKATTDDDKLHIAAFTVKLK
ncbi:MAG: hypothetical protein E6H07_03520 [Bacteroidetes bacterium]|nr:MAG: hypothetical protein E6H07_03520 [Bacteroidota bacterium]